MTLVMRCDEKDRLVGYLYDEGSAAERAAVAAHLARCAACSAELDDLRSVRGHLADWNAPAVDLGFRLTREPLVAASPRRSWTLPPWAQAAAALLVLATGAGLSNLQIQYGSGGLRVRTGWGNAETHTGPADPKSPAANPTPISAADLRALEERLARAERTLANMPPAPELTTSVGHGNPAELLQQVRALLTESEQRQRKEFALRLAQGFRDIEMQRSTDLVRIDQNLRQLEGYTGEQIRGQREMLNLINRVSLSPR
jgi:hypothetical protein